MPFTKSEDRKKIDELKSSSLYMMLNTHYLDDDAKYNVGVSFTPGDKCYYFYKQMIAEWKEERRWTTAHKIYEEMVNRIANKNWTDDTKRAYELAWQVFFAREVMKYEEEKSIENGEV